MSKEFKMLSHRAPVFIAEVGVNHNGVLNLAKELIDTAKEIGANFVKFQSFQTSLLVSPSAKMAPYQRYRSIENSQAEMLHSLELSRDQQLELFEYARNKQIDYISTPFDTKSLDFLVTELELPIIKIGSGDVTDVQLLYKVGATNKRILMSTGMSSIDQIWTALHAIFLGDKGLYPSEIGKMNDEIRQEIIDWATSEDPKVVLLHCTSAYPAPIEELNLRVIQGLEEEFRLPIGYSDHSVGIEAALHAITLGAVVIEKHLTLSQDLPGPDHAASTEPEEFAELIKRSKSLGKMLGKREKEISPSEEVNVMFARKGLYAKERILKGTPYTEQNVSVLRPLGQTPASYFYQVLGTVSLRDYDPGESIIIHE